MKSSHEYQLRSQDTVWTWTRPKVRIFFSCTKSSQESRQGLQHQHPYSNRRKKAAKDFNINTLRATGKPFETITPQRALRRFNRLQATKYPIVKCPSLLIVDACRRIASREFRLEDHFHLFRAIGVGKEHELVETIPPGAEKDADEGRRVWVENDAVFKMDLGSRTDRVAGALVVGEVADPTVVPSFFEGRVCLVDSGQCQSGGGNSQYEGSLKMHW